MNIKFARLRGIVRGSFLLPSVISSARIPGLAVLILFSVILSACATTGSLAPGNGSVLKVSGRNYDEVWRASMHAMGKNLIIVETDQSAGTIRAKSPVGATTWGEVVGLFIWPVTPSADSYTVEVLSRKRLLTQITGRNWEPSVMADLRVWLDQ
jgi:hypothetical protein